MTPHLLCHCHSVYLSVIPTLTHLCKLVFVEQFTPHSNHLETLLSL
jgi:hypothetical protein